MGLEISRISTGHDSNIIGRHRNTLLTNEGNNKVSNPDLDTASTLNVDITQCTKYPLNDPLNLNPNTPSSNFACTAYGTHTILPKDMHESQPDINAQKKGNIPEEYHIIYFQKEHHNEKHQGHLSNIIALKCGKIINIELSMSKQSPSCYINIPTHTGYISPLQLVRGLP